MSLRLLTTSRGLPGLFSRITSQFVQPSGAARRTAALAARLFSAVSACSSSSAAARTSAAAPRSACMYRSCDASLALAIHTPLNPPTPTPCTSRNRCIPACVAVSVMSLSMVLRRPRANSRPSSVSSASSASFSWCDARHTRHSCLPFASSFSASSALSSSLSTSSGVRASITASRLSIGMSAHSSSHTIRSAGATGAPRSWCMLLLSSWIARSTCALPVTASLAPATLTAVMPGRPLIGCVLLVQARGAQRTWTEGSESVHNNSPRAPL
eukprot:scaffold19916_cov71-Phaeocystis_antarctica.AAC.1